MLKLSNPKFFFNHFKNPTDTMKHFFFPLAILTTLLFCRTLCHNSDDHFYKIRIISRVKDPIWVHCKSGDHDLGRQKLTFNREWSFRKKHGFWARVFSTTLYYCYFTWKSRKSSFDVYNTNDRICKPSIPDFFLNLIKDKTESCNTWEVKPDGFHLQDTSGHYGGVVESWK